MALSLHERLELLLRPAGGGIFVHSTGGGYGTRLRAVLYERMDEAGVLARWRKDLVRACDAQIVLVGVPSDAGAGILPGQRFGPMAIRNAYLERYGSYRTSLVDIGDINCVQTLPTCDEMLGESQIEATRAVLYPGQEEPLPVCALSIAEDVLETLCRMNHRPKLIVLGGDHGVSWPAIMKCRRMWGEEFAVLQLDAHPDLSEERQGVRRCFSTWGYHVAMELKPYHLVQVGLRRDIVEKERGNEGPPVVQVFDDEIAEDASGVIDNVATHFGRHGVRAVYISNDIDGTSSQFAIATGTPEPGGMMPEFVKALVGRIGETVGVVGGDIVEVAPPLSGSMDFENDPTCRLAADYLHALVGACSKDAH